MLVALQHQNCFPYAQDEMDTCPYSAPPYGAFSDDHIFPLFLGGRKTVRICKPCNDVFGHSFEGRCSNQLKRLQVFISHFGLDLTRTGATWPAALTIGDDTYDLRPGPDGAQYFLSKPTFIKDAKGNIIGGKARSVSEVKRITGGLIKAGKAKEVEIFTSQDRPIDDVTLTGAFSFNPDLYRTATKMVANALVAFDRLDIIAESDISAYLHGSADRPTSLAYCDVTPIRDLRPGLAHTIYVELGEISYGIVLIFGFQKLFVPLSSVSKSEAFLASLDPLTGDEQFSPVSPIGPRSVPALIQHHEAMSHVQEMNEALAREAVQRRAKHPPQLQTKDLDLGTPVDPAWTSGTIRYMFPPITKRET
ncbi:MAG TPA: HNH endonuclease [Bryobacteraceae bacterium]|jgi:hypothetical protein